MAWSKESRHARGYGAAWDKVRKVIMERDHWLCQCPECAKRQVPLIAHEVDHIVPKAVGKAQGWTQEQMDDPSNLRALNRECHKRITQEQQGRKPADRPQFDGVGRIVW